MINDGIIYLIIDYNEFFSFEKKNAIKKIIIHATTLNDYKYLPFNFIYSLLLPCSFK